MTDSYRPEVSRREALLRLSSTAVAAAALGAGALVFHNRRTTSPSAPPARGGGRPAPPAAPPAAAARGADPAANVRRALVALGGIERFVARGESVLIKPNVGWDRLPDQAANTDPEVIAELVRQCRAAGAGRIVVTDISCNDPRRCFARSGIAAAAAAAGAVVIESGALKMSPSTLSGTAAGLEVIDELLRADRVINVPVAKHHSLSRVTIGMKNWFGVIGDGRNRLHQSINRAIAELGASFRPTLTVVDATRVLLAGGPQGGSLADVKAVNAVAAGTDPVLCDAWGAAQLGIEPGTLGFIVEAEQRGLGRSDLALVDELGTA